jgi:type VI secretion system protein ImpB
MAVVDDIPKSRITLQYPTEVNGKKVKKELPFRMMVMGDFSLGKSKDRKVDFDAREARQLDGTNLDKTIEDMGINLSFSVENKINPDDESELKVSLPITGMKSFNPASVAESVPKIKSLNLMKKLLMELQSTTDNNKSFRRKLNEVLKSEKNLVELKKTLSLMTNYKLPSSSLSENDK